LVTLSSVADLQPERNEPTVPGRNRQFIAFSTLDVGHVETDRSHYVKILLSMNTDIHSSEIRQAPGVDTCCVV